MVRDKIIAAYERMACRYNELIDHKPHNAYYDRPNTLSLIEAPAGKQILDAACGPGKYAELLLAAGAQVQGFDVSNTMVRLARQRNPDSGEFFVHDLAQPLTMLSDASFDIVICALALHYLEDWTLTIQEFNRVLRPGGQLVISVEHPFFEYNYFNASRYFEVEHVKCTWKGFGEPVEVNSYRRPLQECITPLTDNGFYLDRLLEPLPKEEMKDIDPKHYAELQAFPAFLCLRAVKRPE